MNGGIEAVYIFDQHNNPILEHVYHSRPLAAREILPLYLAHPEPRPPLIYLPNTNPPTLVFSILHDQLLFISPAAVDTEPLLVLEFLHRVVDVLEEFLGAPLLASKIEGAYDVVAQLFLEMCDAGTVCNTEPNSLRDVVDVPGWMGKLLGGVGLPVSSPSLSAPSGSLSLQRQHGLAPSSTSTPALPWRRANVRHTSNEIYVDIVETVSVILAPSGRPLSAFANGSIACTAKVSGVPDLLLTLTAPGGKAALDKTLELPVFHPCVRLARWREQPGVLSFVPPDGRFMLAGYEVDLLPNTIGKGMSSASSLHLPASVEMKTSLGPSGADFEARLLLSTNFPSSATTGSLGAASRAGGISSRLGNSSPAFGGTSNQPLLEAIVVTIPIPSSVRNLTDLRASRGEAHYSPGDKAVEWRVSAKEAVMPNGTGGATLRCTVVGSFNDEDEEDLDSAFRLTADTVDYNEDTYQTSSLANATNTTASKKQTEQRDLKRIQQNKTLMPSSAAVSFTVKGWLPSGVKVDSLVINTRTSKGLGDGVKPYKGVKYLTVSKQGVETRC